MSGLPDSYRVTAPTDDPGLGNALERVYEAGQGLIVRRIDLLAVELAEVARGVVGSSITTIAGAFVVLAGWFIAIAGIIDALDAYFPRFAVEIAIGLLHTIAGVAIILQGREREATRKVGLDS